MTLTAAEREALDAYGRYGSVKAAAYALGKSPRTIEQQLASARSRLQAESSAQALYRVRERA